MAFSFSAQLAISKDSPLLVVENLVRVVGGAKWTTSAEKTGADITDGDFPAGRLYDWHGHLVSKPAGALAPTWYLHFDAAPTDDSYPKFTAVADIICIIGHNFHTVSGGVNVTVDTSNSDSYEGSGSYPSDYALLHDFGSVALNDRLVAHPAFRYSGLERLRIKMTSSLGTSWRPEISEIVVGQQYQYAYQSDEGPWDNRELRSRVSEHETKSGVLTRYARKQGQGVFRFQFLIDDPTGNADLQQHRRSWDRALMGTSFGLLIPEPLTSLGNAYIVAAPREFRHPYVGPTARQRSAVFVEQLPYRSHEDGGGV